MPAIFVIIISIFVRYYFSTSDGKSTCNLSSGKRQTCLSYIVNTKAADGLVMQGIRASAVMALTQFAQNIVASAKKG